MGGCGQGRQHGQGSGTTTAAAGKRNHPSGVQAGGHVLLVPERRGHRIVNIADRQGFGQIVADPAGQQFAGEAGRVIRADGNDRSPELADRGQLVNPPDRKLGTVQVNEQQLGR